MDTIILQIEQIVKLKATNYDPAEGFKTKHGVNKLQKYSFTNPVSCDICHSDDSSYVIYFNAYNVNIPMCLKCTQKTGKVLSYYKKFNPHVIDSEIIEGIYQKIDFEKKVNLKIKEMENTIEQLQDKIDELLTK